MKKQPDEYTVAYNSLLTPTGKKIMAWYRKPLKKAGKLYGFTIVTIKPFPKI